MGRFVDGLKHAFGRGIDPSSAPEPLPESLERLAAAVVERGLEVPAIILLDSLRPLSFFAGQALHALTPLARMAGFEEDCEEIARRLDDREMPGRLARRIEEICARRSEAT